MGFTRIWAFALALGALVGALVDLSALGQAQARGNCVWFRNIWIRPLQGCAETAP